MIYKTRWPLLKVTPRQIIYENPKTRNNDFEGNKQSPRVGPHAGKSPSKYTHWHVQGVFRENKPVALDKESYTLQLSGAQYHNQTV